MNGRGAPTGNEPTTPIELFPPIIHQARCTFCMMQVLHSLNSLNSRADPLPPPVEPANQEGSRSFPPLRIRNRVQKPPLSPRSRLRLDRRFQASGQAILMPDGLNGTRRRPSAGRLASLRVRSIHPVNSGPPAAGTILPFTLAGVGAASRWRRAIRRAGCSVPAPPSRSGCCRSRRKSRSRSVRRFGRCRHTASLR